MKPSLPVTDGDALSEKLNLDGIAHHPRLPHTRLSLVLDGFLNKVGEACSWVWVILMAIIVLNVLLRYVFGEGRIEFEELQWHLYAAGWLIAQSFCFVHDDHVRVDLLHDRFSIKAQAWVEMFGMLVLLLPFLALVIWYAIPFIEYAIETGERSNAPGGLGNRWIIKSFLLIGFALIAIAMVARLSRVLALLFSRSASGEPLGTSNAESHTQAAGASHGN